MRRAWIEDEWVDKDRKPTERQGKGSRWRVYWHEDCPPDAQGRTMRRRSQRFTRKTDAQRWVSEIEHGMASGTYRRPELADALFGEVAAEWLASRLHIKGSTYQRYERELRMYVLPQWGARQVGSITKAEVARWIAALSEGDAPARYKVRGTEPPEYQPVGPMNRPLAANSVGHIHTVLSAVLAWAVDTDRIPRNPAAGVRLPRATPSEHVYLNHEQVQALAVAAEGVSGDPGDRTLILLLAYTGLRINEALALDVSSLNLHAARARVRHTWTQDRAGKRVLGTPKTHDQRSVPLPPFLVEELANLITGRSPDEFVFQAPRGGPVNDHNWRERVYKHAVADAALEHLNLTPHKLRHTAASAAISAGADVKVVQQMLGHSSATETLDTYGHLWPDRLDEVATALATARGEELSRVVSISDVPKMSPRAS